ncbi:hypothetical protein EHS39_09075 [Ensifer sp. MPMI2T]|nr:hypothetical protein EHS39_09075 [Ensifer sp. MPMI2T]
MSLYADIAFGRTTKLTQEELNRRQKIIADAIEALREFAPSWEAEVDALRSVGLDRINNALLPAYQQIIEIANLGALLSTTSESSVTIGNGTKTFVVPETKRLNFAPTPYLIAYANGDFDLAMIGTVSSYSSETGELVISVESFTGAGTFASWNIGPVATTSDLEALRDQVEQLEQQTQTAKTAAEAAATNAGTSAAAASASSAQAQAALEEYQETWYGALESPPVGADLGAKFLDISQTPNVVKVLTETGWAPTVTVSIGGSRQQIYVATQGQTGPFTVDGGFTNGAVNVNGVDLYHGHGVTLDAASGTFTLATARDAGDVIVFKGYLANDAVDVYVKTEANERFLTGKQAQAFTSAEKARARANIGAHLLGGFRNKIINGDFDIWQRGTALVISGGGAGTFMADRWRHSGTMLGTTLTVSRQAFSPGQVEVPGNPRYFMRLDRTAVTVNNFGLDQFIEGVHSLSGKQATLTFYAKGTAGKILAIKSVQLFGSGGAPSASVDTIIGTAVLSASWQKFQFTFNVPSIAGKTVGTNGDDKLAIELGLNADQGVMIADIAHVSLVEGDATGEDDPFSPRHPQQELALCERYFEKSYDLSAAPGTSTALGALQHRNAVASSGIAHGVRFKTRKRAIPSVVSYSTTGASGFVRNTTTLTDVTSVPGNIGDTGYLENATIATAGNSVAWHYTADAEL